MAIPYSSPVQTVFNAAALTATVNLTADTQLASSVMIQYITAGWTGTLDFQGSLDNVTWVNVPYVIVATGALASVVAQVSKTTNTANYLYILTMPMPYMKVVMTRSAGSITMYARTYSEPFFFSQAVA